MHIRKLKSTDAPLMLEWMHDPSVVENLQKDFSRQTITDCEDFIKSAQDDFNDIHYAIVDDNDEYMGTVSLKHCKAGNAEFAITMRKCAMGKGLAKIGMEEMIKKGFEDYLLNMIYWCVAAENQRAIRFYNKNGYRQAPIDAQLALGGVQHKADSEVHLVRNYQRGNAAQVNMDVDFLFWSMHKAS